MIRIYKSDESPKKLLKKGEAQKLIDCGEFDSHDADYLSGKKKLDELKLTKLNPNIYRLAKEKLNESHFSKCCYCELIVKLPDHLHVEHFRPARGVTKEIGDKHLLYPGYYWLAYNWKNLLLSCGECNSHYKKNLFPLDDESKRARSHHDDHKIDEESPVLVNPSLEDPRQHIIFDYETPLHKTERGRLTIKILGLRSGQLFERRKEHLDKLRESEKDIECFEKLEEYMAENPEDERLQTIREYLESRAIKAAEFIQSCVEEKAEFSSMCLDYLNRPTA